MLIKTTSSVELPQVVVADPTDLVLVFDPILGFVTITRANLLLGMVTKINDLLSRASSLETRILNIYGGSSGTIILPPP